MDALASTEPRPVDLGDLGRPRAVAVKAPVVASTEPRPVDLGDEKPEAAHERARTASTEPRPVDLGDEHELRHMAGDYIASTEPRPVDLGDASATAARTRTSPLQRSPGP